MEASQFEPGLQADYPNIRSFRLVIPSSTEIVGRLNVSPEGVFAVVLEDGGAVEITHEREGKRIAQYIERVDVHAERAAFTCGVEDEGLAPFGKTGTPQKIQANSCFQLGTTLRRYRIALTNTGEFAQLNGGTVTGVNAAFNRRLAELNAIYEREASITFVLIAGNDVLISLDPANDTFPNPLSSADSRPRAAKYINDRIPVGNFDIGHGLHETDQNISINGQASVGVVCRATFKSSAFSTVRSTGSLVIFQHEVGHQFSCEHTNYGCQNPSNESSQRYEPGQGVTIMATAVSTCTSTDTYASIDRTYFHVGSLRAINNYIAGLGSCFAAIATTNSAPVADANPDGGTYVIPANTPFLLEGAGTDADAQTLTYNWEQIDTDAQAPADPTQTANRPTAPLFRSFAADFSPNRYLPRLSTILAGVLPDGSDGEVLPNVSRNLTFDLTVRDGSNGIACDERQIQVVNTGRPSASIRSIRRPALRQMVRTTATIIWSVAGTDVNGINTAKRRHPLQHGRRADL